MLKKYSSIVAAALLMSTASYADFDSSTDTKWNYLFDTYTNVGGIIEDNKVTNPPFTIDKTILDTMFASLPEGNHIDHLHPEYFPAEEPEIIVTGDAEVFVTFYSEGAGYRNTLGYYAYEGDTGRALPTTRQELQQNGVLIFPNSSKRYSGGDLDYGTTVSLGEHSEGTKIIFFLVSNGWKNNNVRNGPSWVFSSWSALNEEPDQPGFVTNKENGAPNKRHVALLWKSVADAQNNTGNTLLMGFEDIKRTYGSCDHDFNDALFSVSSNPLSALSDTVKESGDSSKQGFSGAVGEEDTDGDGVNDPFDTYPDDPNRAYDSYYPSKTDTATLAYEDLWPFEGDYDMNDVTISFQIQEVQDKDKKVKDIKFTGNAESYGASYYNGFSIALDTPAANIASATMEVEGFSNLEYEATVDTDEDGNAVITLLSNTTAYESKIKQLFTVGYDIVDDNKTDKNHLGNNIYWNVFDSRNYIDIDDNNYQTYVKSDTFTLTVTLTEPADLMAPPYNPFITVAGHMQDAEGNTSKDYQSYTNDRREVHLPKFMPTTVDKSWYHLFGLQDDDTEFETGKTYMTLDNKPWALLIPTKFAHPAEYQSIFRKEVYRHFQDWVDSNGTEYQDWYVYDKRNDAGQLYGNPDKIIIRD